MNLNYRINKIIKMKNPNIKELVQKVIIPIKTNNNNKFKKLKLKKLQDK